MAQRRARARRKITAEWTKGKGAHCFGFGLARAARSRDRGQGRLMAEMVAAAQVGDSLLAAALLTRRELSWRVALAVWAGVVPTIVATRAARGRLS